jgi:hypothetical protein
MSNQIVQGIETAVARAARRGIEGWGLHVPFDGAWESVEVRPAQSESDRPIIKAWPRHGALISLGSEDEERDGHTWTYNYYAVLIWRGVKYYAHVQRAHHGDHLGQIERCQVPSWALAAFDRKFN